MKQKKFHTYYYNWWLWEVRSATNKWKNGVNSVSESAKIFSCLFDSKLLWDVLNLDFTNWVVNEIKCLKQYTLQSYPEKKEIRIKNRTNYREKGKGRKTMWEGINQKLPPRPHIDQGASVD